MVNVWFVTGSSRGLGREIVEAALNAGDRVVATARKPEQLKDLSEKFGDRVLALALDVADSADVAKAVAEGYKAFGRYDIVVNNAGYGDMASIEDTTLESFEKQIATNFMGVVYVTKAVLPILREQGNGAGARRYEDRLGGLFDDDSASERTLRANSRRLRKDAA